MILVTGATGMIGGALVRRMHDEGVPTRAFVRDPSRGDLPPGVEVAVGDYADPASLEPALDGVDGVFLLWSTGRDETAADVVSRIAARVPRIVYLSSGGAPADPADASDPITASHSLLEKLVRESGATWTFPRVGGLASNTLAWAEEVRAESVVREPFGGVPRALMHEKDAADVAFLALTEEGHAGRTYEMSGPAVVTGPEQVQAIADAIGREVRLEPLDAEAAVERMTAAMGDADIARGMVAGWEQMASSPADPPTGVVEALTGRPGRTFAEWARDHRADFA